MSAPTNQHTDTQTINLCPVFARLLLHYMQRRDLCVRAIEFKPTLCKSRCETCAYQEGETPCVYSLQVVGQAECLLSAVRACALCMHVCDRFG